MQMDTGTKQWPCRAPNLHTPTAVCACAAAGYLGNGYDDGTGAGPALGGYNAHHATALPAGKGAGELPSHTLHAPQHVPNHGLYQQHATYPNAGRDGYYSHTGYQGDSQAFDRRNYGHSHYPQGGPYKNS